MKYFSILCLIFCLGVPAISQTIYYSKPGATNFNTAASWGVNADGSGAGPVSVSNSDNYVVANGAALSVSASASVRKLTIDSGSVAVTSGTLTVAIPGQNNTSLEVTGGTLNVSGTGGIVLNGNFLQSSGAFNQDGGTIIIDGNNNNLAATSVASGMHHFNITGGTANCTGGSITIVDPPVSSYAIKTTRAISISLPSTMNAFSGTHTFIIGNGISNTAGNSDGFTVETRTGGYCYIQNLTVNSGSGPGRYASSSYGASISQGVYLKGTLTISAGSEFRINSNGTANDFVSVGSIVNNGVFTTGRLSSSTTICIGTDNTTVYLPAIPSLISGSGLFRNLAAAPKASFLNLTFNNPAGIAFAPGSLATGFDGHVSGTLKFTAGEINLNGQTFSLGYSTIYPGTLSYTAGGFSNGSFRRWYGAGLPASLSSTVPEFPFVKGQNVRNVYLAKSGTYNPGTITAILSDSPGLVTVPSFSDAGYVVDRRTAATWSFATGDGFNQGTSTFSLGLEEVDLFYLRPALNQAPRLITTTGAPGSHLAPTGTIYKPMARRSGLTLSQLTSSQFVLGINAVEIPFTSVSSGAWTDPATWSTNTVPAATDFVWIKSGHVVSHAAGTAVAGNLLIDAGSTVNVSGGSLIAGDNDSARSIFNKGTLNLTGGAITLGLGTKRYHTLNNTGTVSVSNGTLTIYGNLTSLSGSSFNQSGGNIEVDGNDGTSTGSVTSGVPIVQFNNADLNLTGGVLTITDPHQSSTTTAALSCVASPVIAIPATHTIRFGSTLSGDAGGDATTGYLISAASTLNLGNLEIVASATSNRFVTAGAVTVNGNIQVNANAELRINATLTAKGNITNNGTLTTTGTLVLAGPYAPSTATQTIGGTGSFKHSLTLGGANFANLTINNSGAAGVTFANTNSVLSGINAGTVNGTLSFLQGVVTVVGGKPLMLGSSPTTLGTLAYTAGGFSSGSIFGRYISGTAAVNFGSAPAFPFVANGQPRHAYLQTTSPMSTGGFITCRHNDIAGLLPFSATDAGYTVQKRTAANWVFSTTVAGLSNSINSSDVTTIGLSGNGLISLQTMPGTNPRVLKATNTPGVHRSAEGTPGAPIGFRAGMYVANLPGQYHLCVSDTNLTGIETAQSGAWEDTATWVGGVIPSPATAARIRPGHSVTVNAATAESSDLHVEGILNLNADTLRVTGGIATGVYIASGGAVNINGGNFYLGTSASARYDATLRVDGTFNLSSGNLNVYGNMVAKAGSSYSQTGGSIVLDGAKDDNPGLSVAAGTPFVSFQTGNLVLSGGSLTIVDGHTPYTSQNCLEYNAATHIDATGHTLVLGNGISTTGSSFTCNTGAGGGILQFGNVTINTVNTNRVVSGTWRIAGNLVIFPGSILNTTGVIYVGGNITNNGRFTSGGTLYLGKFSSGLAGPSNTPQTITGTGLFESSSYYSDFHNLTVNNTSTAGVTLATSPALWTHPVSVYSTFTIVNGRINIDTNTFVLGTYNIPGILAVTNGGFTSGARFSRVWLGPATGSAINPGTVPGDATGLYPFVSADNKRRSMYIQRNFGALNPGVILVRYTEASGKTLVNIPDGSDTVNQRSNDSWQVTTGGDVPYYTPYEIAILGQGLFNIKNGDARIINNSSVVGVSAHQQGTTLPLAQRTAMSNAELIAGPLYLGYSFNDTGLIPSPLAPDTLSTAHSGDWHNPSTWLQNAVPDSTQVARINSGDTVTVSTVASAGRNLIIATGAVLQMNGSNLQVLKTLTNNGTVVAAGGTLQVSGGTVQGIVNATGSSFLMMGGTVKVGPTDAGFNNTSFVNNGILDVSAGLLKLYGNLNVAAGSALSQSGGVIEVDGNLGGATTGSVASGTHLVSFSSTAISLTGGILRIIDPHAAGYYVVDVASDIVVYTTNGHLTEFGNGISTDPGSFGFATASNMTFGSVKVVGTPAAVNRHVNSSSAILGNLLVTGAGADYRSGTSYLGGNLTVDAGAFYTNTATLYLADYTNNLISPSTVSQAIGGAGTFRNLVAAPTSNLTDLTVYNSTAGGVTLNVPVSLSGILTLQQGILNTSTTNLLTISNTATTPAKVVGGSAGTFVRGPLARTFAANKSTSFYFFYPVGGNSYSPFYLDPFTNAGGPVVMAARALDTNTGTAGTSLLNVKASRRWETSISSGSANLTSSALRIGDSGIVQTSGVGMASSASGAYNLQSSVFGADAPNTLTASTQIPAASFTGFFGYGEQVPKSLQSVTAIQQTGFVVKSSVNNNILRLDLPVSGTAGTLLLNQLAVTFTGTTVSDLSSNGVKLYAGTASGPVTQIGTSQIFSGGIATFASLNYGLSSGQNYLWITFDVSSLATIDNYIDAKIMAGSMSLAATGGATMPSGPQPALDADPAGARRINYCLPTYLTGCGSGNHVSNVSIAGLNHSTGCSGDAGFYSYYDTVAAAILEQGSVVNATVTMGADANQFAAVWIDFNNNGTFETTEGFISGTNAGANGTATIAVTVPAGALAGNTRMRVRGGNDIALTTSQPCTSVLTVGESEDYRVTIGVPTARVLGTISALQQTGAVGLASANNAMLRLNLPVSGSQGTLTLNSLKATYTGTSAADIPAAGLKLWLGSATAPVSMLGTAQSLSAGTVTFNGLTQILGIGNNYLWLTADIAASAIMGNVADLKIAAGDIVIGASGSAATTGSQPGNDLDPAGNRIIDYCIPTYAFGCGSGNAITNVSVGTLSNASTCAGGPEYYTFYNTLTQPAVQQGATHNVSITMGNDATGQYAGVWIDFNGNNFFEASEGFVSTSNAGANGTAVIPVTVPANALPGVHRMRIRGGNDAALTTGMACGVSSGNYGETEDYLVNITPMGCASATFPPTLNAVASQGSVCFTGTVNFSTSAPMPNATGITYRWQRSVDSGASYANTGIADTLAAATFNVDTTALYRVVVYCNNLPVLTSAAAGVTVIAPQILSTLPGSNCGPGAVTLTATANPGAAVSWYSAATGGTSLATGSTFTSPVINATTTYYAQAAIGGCIATRQPVTATIGVAPGITAQPAAAVVCTGDSTTFTVSAANATAYQWRKNGISIPGATSPVYALAHASPADSGSYDVIVYGAAPCSPATSAAATLTVNYFVWTGALSGSWTDAANWSACGVPGPWSYVLIPPVSANPCTISTTVNIRSIQSDGPVNVIAPGVLNILGPL